jgi:hypothetical protein
MFQENQLVFQQWNNPVGCDTMLFVSEQHAVSIFRVPDVSEYYVPNVTFNKTNLNFPAVRTTTIG